MRHHEFEPGPRSFRHVIVRFQNHLVLGMEHGRLTAKDAHGHPVNLDHFHAIVSQAGGQARQSYPRIAADLRKRSIRSTTGIDRYVDVTVPRIPGTGVNGVAGSLEALHDIVVFAMESWTYALASPPPLDPLRDKQGYLKSRMRRGVSAMCAWRVPGGDGTGVVVCVCDVALKEHKDLPAPTRIFGTFPSYLYEADIRHAHSALGVIAAIKDNPFGVTGISPKSEIWFATTNGIVKVIKAGNQTEWQPFDTAGLDEMYEAMPEGGIVVLEMQTEAHIDGNGDVSAPAEMNPHVRAWIRVAAENRGILTIVPAGTRTQAVDLGTLKSPYIVPGTSPEQWEWGFLWNGLPETDPNHSWGVMVGGGDPDSQKAISITNWGVRVDCQGWGARVFTTGGPGLEDYVDDFDGTSSAAAVVGGVAASLQGAYIKAYGASLAPSKIRSLLSNPKLGIPQPRDDAASKHIGPLPDLATMLRKLRILGDIYIRDHLNDDGATPYTGPGLFMSPDIIVSQAGALSVDDEAFWDEHLDEDLSGEISVGVPNDVFVRLHNRSMNPGGVEVNAYWTEPGLFLDPEVWNKIGDTVSTIVPAYDHKVVRIPWEERLVPEAGKYCLIATIHSECDPLGIDGEFESFPDYKQFLRTSNNIAHRNVQAVDLPLGEKKAIFSFFLRGIPRMEDWLRDQGFFRLEIGGHLPRATVLTLRPERAIPGMEGGPGESILGDHYEVTAPAPLILRGFRLPAGARIPIRLEVTLPEIQREATIEFHADQFHDDDHLGRVNFVIRYGPIA